MKKKLAFTLAEVLVTLGIIGIVAAMTMPSLIQNNNEKKTVVALKAAYSIFEQAFKMTVQNDNSPENWGFNDLETVRPEDGSTPHYESEQNKISNEIIFNNFKTHLKVIKVCEAGDSSCLKTVNKISTSSGILANGMSFNVIVRNGSCKGNYGNNLALQNVCADITVDVDGPSKGKNAWGKDWFRFYITKYGIVPKGTMDERNFPFERSCINASEATYGGKWGESCTAWVIQNENMDYLHCNDLSWSGKTKCD